jgi:hypothetical protein
MKQPAVKRGFPETIHHPYCRYSSSGRNRNWSGCFGLSAGAGDKDCSSDTVNGPNAVPTSAPTRLELVDIVVEQQRIRNGILTNVKRQIGSFVEMDDPREFSNQASVCIKIIFTPTVLPTSPQYPMGECVGLPSRTTIRLGDSQTWRQQTKLPCSNWN